MSQVLDEAESANVKAMQKVRRLLRSATGKKGASALQFETFRANYLLRTCTTPLSVAAVVAEALRQRPPDVPVARRIANEALMDELGPLDGKSHIDLLLACLDVTAYRNFRSPKLRLKGIKDHHLILPAARDYDEHQQRMFSSGDYPAMLGALYGRERAARFMLEVIQETLFEPLMGKLSILEQRKVRRYFDVHLQDEDKGREEAHAIAARKTLAPHLQDKATRATALDGAVRTLKLQSDFFLAIARRLTELAGSTGS